MPPQNMKQERACYSQVRSRRYSTSNKRSTSRNSECCRIANHAGDPAQCSRNQFDGQTTVVRSIERKPDPESTGRQIPQSGIIGGMANQQCRGESKPTGPPVRLMHQRRADPLPLKRRSHGERSHPQRIENARFTRNRDPGQKHLPHDPVRGNLGDKRQSGDKGLRTAQRRNQQVFRMVADRQRTKSLLDQPFNRRKVVRMFRTDRNIPCHISLNTKTGPAQRAEPEP